MHNRCDGVLTHRRRKERRVIKIAFNQRPPARGFPMTTRQIVEHHRRATRSGQRLAGVTADIAGPSSHQDSPRDLGRIRSRHGNLS